MVYIYDYHNVWTCNWLPTLLHSVKLFKKIDPLQFIGYLTAIMQLCYIIRHISCKLALMVHSCGYRVTTTSRSLKLACHLELKHYTYPSLNCLRERYKRMGRPLFSGYAIVSTSKIPVYAGSTGSRRTRGAQGCKLFTTHVRHDTNSSIKWEFAIQFQISKWVISFVFCQNHDLFASRNVEKYYCMRLRHPMWF